MPTQEELIIGVVNLEKRAERVELRVRSLERMAATPCSMVGRVESRLEALEAKLKARDHVDVLHADSLKHVIDKFDTRIEALEGVNEVGMSLDELRRQDRWHATRDAVLPAIAATAVDHAMTDAECVHDAARFADAAHGPLEAKAPVVETYNMTAAYVAEVNALVEAARKHVHEERDTQYAMPTDELEAALKPFEAVKGGL